ncbi:MAG TPA: hypothetical protein VFJ90_02195 [Candidatus Didemnitutus sp.]|nr:hypothetical protein [Candidatus Didemnitutus sp.]
MNRNLALFFIALLSLLPAVRATELSPPPPTSDWSFSLSPYLWVAAVKVETTLDSEPPPPGPTPPTSPDKFETKLSGGALLAAQVHYKSLGLWADFVWIQTTTDALQSGPLYSAKELKSDFYHSTIALSYTVTTPDNYHLEFLAGARYWSVDAQVNASAGALPAFSASQKETWVTPVIGADLRCDFNAQWSLLLKGTFAVGNYDSNGWEAMGGVAYKFGPSWSATLGYRYLHEEYKRERFAYFTDVSGVVLGASWQF